MDKATAQSFIQAAHDRAWQRLRTMYGSKVGTKPTIELNTRLRTTAGRAFLLCNKIDISYKLLVEFSQDFANNTIPHECAHFVAYRVFGEKNHGKPWKYIMAELGLPTTPYHNLIEQRKIKELAAEAGITLPKKIVAANGKEYDLMPLLLKVIEAK